MDVHIKNNEINSVQINYMMLKRDIHKKLQFSEELCHVISIELTEHEQCRAGYCECSLRSRKIFTR